MFAEIITIGDEILIGQIVDTNSAWIAQQLNQAGILVNQITSISDTKEHITKALDEARERASLVLMTGGLGPTKDDITKKTLVNYFDSELVINEEILEWVKEIFNRFNVPMPEVNKYQAAVPDKCTPLMNRNGTAPGMWFEDNGTVFVSMPGVPYEMKGLMEHEVLPRVKNHFQTPDIFYKTILTQGIGESSLMELITDWENSLDQYNIKLAYLPSAGIVRLRLSILNATDPSIELVLNKKVEELLEIIPEYVFGFGTDKLETVVGRLLEENRKTMSTAESCTGGYIGHLITSIPGSSHYYNGSVVSYANSAKTDLLQVDQSDLDRVGAVSEEVVLQMAKQVRENLNTDYSIATSGIAGPDGGTDEKPVGTVWIAVSGPNRTIAQKYSFGNNRERNIRRSAVTGLNMLRKEILKDT